MNIPRNDVATCLVKCKERECRAGYFDKGVAPLQCEKAVPTNGRMRLFAARFGSQATFRGWVWKFFRLRKKPLFSVIP